MHAIVWWFEHSLVLPFFMIGTKTDLFQSYGHCWVFQICWHIECSTFTASSFKSWNSSAGIPSPALALFIVVLCNAHLTSHYRMSGFRWVITSSWFSGSLRTFFGFFHGFLGFPSSSAGKESTCNAGDPSMIPGSGRSTGEGIGYPLQYSWHFLVAQLIKNLPAMWETWVPSLG